MLRIVQLAISFAATFSIAALVVIVLSESVVPLVVLVGLAWLVWRLLGDLVNLDG